MGDNKSGSTSLPGADIELQKEFEQQQLATICGYTQHMQQPEPSSLGVEGGARLLSRADWGARMPKSVEHFEGPAPYVIIHHSYMPAACFSTPDCMKSMRDMQDFHQLERGWNDIGYSFGIGGDGMIYTGRGFNVIGAHAPKYNDKSVGIVLIGDWRTELPPKQMLDAARNLIAFGVFKGYIDPAYKLLGHKQVRETECPGGRLFQEISTWPHFNNGIRFNATTEQPPQGQAQPQAKALPVVPKV
ncbi:peptidoglycan-recognition protein LB isoform X3 [Drosophila persimilis]|uniref:peptidoglycan-recognition protein LB isoform X3 n=1 Tax=Drosophila persimilis TaxID=7234 RepID=UPI000F0737ED|nr:peptidoglycan-recognition protein LB isoform X3 [Drosophila persimilis]